MTNPTNPQASNKPFGYAAVIRYLNAPRGQEVSVQEYFCTIKEARAWIAQQRHDPTQYTWEVMKYV